MWKIQFCKIQFWTIQVCSIQFWKIQINATMLYSNTHRVIECMYMRICKTSFGDRSRWLPHINVLLPICLNLNIGKSFVNIHVFFQKQIQISKSNVETSKFELKTNKPYCIFLSEWNPSAWRALVAGKMCPLCVHFRC